MENNEKIGFGARVKGWFTGPNKKFEITDLALPILLVVIIAIFAILTPTFLTTRNISTFFAQNSHLLIVTAAVMIIMISGGCDLSISWQISLTSIVMAIMMSDWGVHPVLACLIGVAMCALLGTLNGFLGVVLKSSTMIITLATAAIFKGLSFLIANNRTVDVPEAFTALANGKIGNFFPYSTIIMIGLLVIVSIVMGFTSVGRKVYASGDNPEAARLAGLKVNKIKILSFTFAGILIGIATCIYASKSISIEVGSVGNTGIEFTGITACVLSGVALKGGEGKLWKVVVATFILAVLENGCIKLSISAETAGIFKGIIMIASLSLMTFQGGKPAGIRTFFKNIGNSFKRNKSEAPKEVAVAEANAKENELKEDNPKEEEKVVDASKEENPKKE